jgi:hypothetical protein
LAVTTTALSQSAGTTMFGEPLTLTATVTSQSGTPTGAVVFLSDGVTIGSAPLQSGVAAVTIGTLAPATHAIIAGFLGTGVFGNSASSSVPHVVTRGLTKAQINADHATTYGQTLHFTVTVTAQAPAAGQPGGSVTILADGNAIGTVPVVNGTATFETALLHAGARSITATYSGDVNFEGSAAPAIQHIVGKAHTVVEANADSVLIGASPLISVSIRIPNQPALVPSGSVSIAEFGTILDMLPLAHSAVAFTLAPLPPCDHRLALDYSGDADFEASSATVIQTVGAPAISFHVTRVNEGNRGVTVASIVVSLSASILQPVRVSFSTVPGSAAEGEDYEKTSGVIEFAPGELTRSIEIRILGDTVPEADETFTVMLSNPQNATIDTPSAVIVITNDDQVPPRHRSARH